MPPPPPPQRLGVFWGSLSPFSPRSGLVIAMVASLLFIVLLRFVAGAVLGAALLLLVVVLGYGAWDPPPSHPGDPRDFRASRRPC